MTQFINYPEIECPEATLIFYHRFYTIITLKGSLFKMVHSLIGGHIAHNAYEKISQSLKNIVDEVLKALNNNNKKETEY